MYVAVCVFGSAPNHEIVNMPNGNVNNGNDGNTNDPINNNPLGVVCVSAPQGTAGLVPLLLPACVARSGLA